MGIIASVWASAYYFRKLVRKSLTPYIQFYSSPFIGIADDVKKTLQISYNGMPIDELFEIQFVIQNTGDKAVCNLMEPLSFEIPAECTLLDASLLHCDPKELKISLNIEANRRSFSIDFKLLNSRDFFVLKVLLNGVPEIKNLKFNILVDELPPVLTAVQLSTDAISTSTKKPIEFSLLGIGLFLLFFGLVLIAHVYYGSHSHSFDFNKLFTVESFRSLIAILSIIPALVLTMAGAMISTLTVFSGRYPFVRKRIVLPEGLNRPQWRLFARDAHASDANNL